MHKYTHLISPNIAPVHAKRIGVYRRIGNTDVRCFGIRLGRLCHVPTGNKRYSFCVLSDIHLDENAHDEKVAVFTQAMNFVNSTEDCAFTCICGDLVEDGRIAAQTENYRAVIKEIAQKPVYAIPGNHDTMWGYPTDEWTEHYTAQPLCYTISHAENPDIAEGNLLIFLGHYGKDHSDGNGDWRGGEQFSSEELAWFEKTMAANVNKRCFVFIHPYIPGGAGNPPLTVIPPNPPPDIWTKKTSVASDAGTEFLNILKKYPSALLFNGHSHYCFHTQEIESKAIIYTPDDQSYTSIHVPSATKLRDIVNGKREDTSGVGEGYIVDVYDDCILLRGVDLLSGSWSGIASYRIG